ncbi:ejaculatory bulb-specific protein 3-like [Malaya genurostris]|uniref:ejaculatory bulb-specific protein 3-like n=1 Tax=Malaya genurostris TaxID=325434 RepID=UPI0026F3D59F|nr:ejaculatory bulb-specific protein 3-like [Malaya genurostris]
MFTGVIYLSVTVCFLTVAVIAENYVTKYDDIDLDEVFKSTRLVNNYVNCLKNIGPCTPDAKELKEKLPDALENDCMHCSEKQKAGANKVIRFIIENRTEDFNILESMYDPTGEYRRKYLDERTKFRQQQPMEETTSTRAESNQSDSASSSEEATTDVDQGQSEGH